MPRDPPPPPSSAGKLGILTFEKVQKFLVIKAFLPLGVYRFLCQNAPGWVQYTKPWRKLRKYNKTISCQKIHEWVGGNLQEVDEKTKNMQQFLLNWGQNFPGLKCFCQKSADWTPLISDSFQMKSIIFKLKYDTTTGWYTKQWSINLHP